MHGHGHKTLVSLLLFVGSAMGRGRGGGGVSIGSVDDGWDAPGALKAAFAFQTIWVIIGLVQLIYILKNLRAIPSMASRGPYILLAVCTLCLVVYNVLVAIYNRVDFFDYMTGSGVLTASTFFWDVDAAFRPAVVLYLIHRRGDILRAVKANTTTPLSTYTWKRVLDWVLAALAWIMYTGSMAATASRLAAIYGSAYGTYYDLSQTAALARASLGLGYAGLAIVILLMINLVVSTSIQFVQGKGTSGDLVTRRLLIVVVPLFILYAIETLVFSIYSRVHTFRLSDEVYGYELASVIIDGSLTTAITAALILTMTIPGVNWVPETAVPEVVPPPPEKQWATPSSGWSQPYPPNAGWGQPTYNPQQQSPFYPQPHPMFQQMQQQHYPYSPPTQIMPNQVSQYSQYSPPTQSIPNQPAQH